MTEEVESEEPEFGFELPEPEMVGLEDCVIIFPFGSSSFASESKFSLLRLKSADELHGLDEESGTWRKIGGGLKVAK